MNCNNRQITILLKIDNEELETKIEKLESETTELEELYRENSDIKQKEVSVLNLNKKNKALKDKLNHFEEEFEN